MSGIASGGTATFSSVTGDAIDVARDVVPAGANGEADVREFDGEKNLVPPGDEARLKTPSSVCRTNTSPDDIYLLGKILESLGSMFCLNKRDQQKLGGEAESRGKVLPHLKRRVYSLSAPYTLLYDARRRALHNTRCCRRTEELVPDDGDERVPQRDSEQRATCAREFMISLGSGIASSGTSSSDVGAGRGVWPLCH